MVSGALTKNFNPRSREGSDAQCLQNILVRYISIHAPAKGATFSRSRHTACRCYFNPRSREGSDTVQAGNAAAQHISIHAPAKGATCAGRPPELSVKFQSTLPRRERPGSTYRMRCGILFQSTLPRRERRDVSCPADRQRDFNPRSREGSDENSHRTAEAVMAFQSTLPRRERLDKYLDHLREVTFQSTLPRRERHKIGCKRQRNINFNPRSREGSDACLLAIVRTNDISIHAPAKGAT